MSDQTEADAPTGIKVVDSGDIAEIRRLLNASVAQMTEAIESVEKHDAVDASDKMINPQWPLEMDRRLRHFQSSKAAVQYGSWMLRLAHQENSEKAASELAGTQARLSSRLNWLTGAMVAAVAVQAIAAVITAWLASRGTPVPP